MIDTDPDAPAVRYHQVPLLHISYSCGGLSCRPYTIEFDDGAFICSDCKTLWTCEDDGQLYQEWSGEDYDGPTVHPFDWKFGRPKGEV